VAVFHTGRAALAAALKALSIFPATVGQQSQDNTPVFTQNTAYINIKTALIIKHK
jgi:hypothetical protein